MALKMLNLASLILPPSTLAIAISTDSSDFVSDFSLFDGEAAIRLQCLFQNCRGFSVGVALKDIANVTGNGLGLLNHAHMPTAV